MSPRMDAVATNALPSSAQGTTWSIESPFRAEPLTRLHPVSNSRAKRTFDIVFSVVSLALLAPIFLIIAILIKVSSSGDVIYAQRRCGRDGKYFLCYKFRTMVPGAHWVLEQDDLLKASYVKHWKLVRDPRVTPLGRILRKTSLDELPQLWNVLKGEMSIVGPRPVQPDELRECYGHQAGVVTAVRPGMTGLWQVSGRSTLSYEQRVALDVQYVDRHSLMFDAGIILRTIPAILLAKGAR